MEKAPMSDVSQDPGEGKIRRQVAMAFKEADGHLHEAIRTLEDLRDELMDPDADANTDDDEALAVPDHLYEVRAVLEQLESVCIPADLAHRAVPSAR